ncbi:hypothetical protein QVD17_06093 [Tagetes erecta]|uniref:Uncharacterized protein n=1 Tax=Tagetes erecta TaxID=13708 RepID=A0AAD8PB18_TARER|nr:hypothetical protein QVD17_06093 [Tagetes erecta]
MTRANQDTTSYLKFLPFICKTPPNTSSSNLCAKPPPVIATPSAGTTTDCYTICRNHHRLLHYLPEVRNHHHRCHNRACFERGLDPVYIPTAKSEPEASEHRDILQERNPTRIAVSSPYKLQAPNFPLDKFNLHKPPFQSICRLNYMGL